MQRNEAIDLNSIHVNPASPNEFAAAGDEEWAYVYDARMIRMQRQSLQVTPMATPVDQYCPSHLVNEGRRAFAHITACSFSRRGELLLSYSGDGIFLFHPWLKGQSQQRRGDAAVEEVRLPAELPVFTISLEWIEEYSGQATAVEVMACARNDRMFTTLTAEIHCCMLLVHLCCCVQSDSPVVRWQVCGAGYT